MKLLLAALSILFCTCFVRSQTPADDLKSLFPPGKHIAKLFMPDQAEQTAEDARFMQKLQNAMQKDSSFLIDIAGGKLDVDSMLKKMGITREDVEAYMKNRTGGKMSIHITGTDSFEVIRNDNHISFRGSSSLHALDGLDIDAAQNKVSYKGQNIPARTSNEKNEMEQVEYFKNMSKKYYYEYREDPTSADLSHMMDNMASYLVGIGHVDSTGETLLVIVALKSENGKMIVNVTLPLLFK